MKILYHTAPRTLIAKRKSTAARLQKPRRVHGAVELLQGKWFVMGFIYSINQNLAGSDRIQNKHMIPSIKNTKT